MNIWKKSQKGITISKFNFGMTIIVVPYHINKTTIYFIYLGRKCKMEQIKQIKIADLQDCVKVINKSFATVAREFNLSEQNCPRHPSFMEIDTLQKRFTDGYQMFGLYEQEKLVGYVSISIDEDNAAELHNLAVLPGYRHKGYGKRLLDYCETKAKEMGCNKIKIEIIEENRILKNWYLKNGFIHLFIKKFDYLPFTVGFMEKHI